MLFIVVPFHNSVRMENEVSKQSGYVPHRMTIIIAAYLSRRSFLEAWYIPA